MREGLLANIVQILGLRGYTVSSFLEFNSCIDIAAKKNDHAFVIKVLSNVDSLRGETAAELYKAATLFSAMPLILGEKTKTTGLEQNTRYERFGIPVFSLETFTDFLDGKNPLYHSFKGKQTVQLDSKRLSSERQEQHLTQQELADKIGVSMQTIHRYENGAPAELTDARKIEELLRCRLITPRMVSIGNRTDDKNLFQTDFSDTALEKLHDLGMPLSLFCHAPFKAFANPDERILISIGKEKRDIERKALVLEKTKTVFKSHSIVISKEYKLHNVGKTPIIVEEELGSFSKMRDLLSEIQKREQKKS